MIKSNDFILNIEHIDNLLNYLSIFLKKLPRKKPGNVKLGEFVLHYTDFNSMFWELKQIFKDHIYKFITKKESPVILDCGAHIGLATLFFCLEYPNAKIYAFEADPVIYNYCVQNITTFGVNNAYVYNKAVWIHNGTVYFRSSLDDSGFVDTSGNISVNAVRLRDFIENLIYVDLLKMDIEGGEFIVLPDCADVLYKVEKVIVEVHCLKGNKMKLSKIFEPFDKVGFRYVISDFHIVDWVATCKEKENIPFSFIENDRFIFTIFAWK